MFLFNRPLLAIGMALLVATTTACGGSSSNGQSSADSATSVNASATQTVTASVAASPTAKDPRGYTDADIVESFTITDSSPYKNGHWSESIDLDNNNKNAVGYKYWDCSKNPDDVFNNIMFRVWIGSLGTAGYPKGQDKDHRGPVDMTEDSGQGLVYVWDDSSSMQEDVEVYIPGECSFQIDIVSIGVNGAGQLGTKVFEQSGSDNENIDVSVDLRTPWYMAWQSSCPSAAHFAIADDQLGGKNIVTDNGPSDSGVFTQFDSSGPRTLMVVVSNHQCEWKVEIYQ